MAEQKPPRRPGPPGRRGEPSGSRAPRRNAPGDQPGGQKPHGGRQSRRSESPARGDRPTRREHPERGERSRFGDRRERSGQPATAEPIFPAIDPDVEPRQLDRIARRELQALDKEAAEHVANHLVMAARLIDDDPQGAHDHALAALHKGSRIPVVRETVGITAYLTGDFALALRELRTHRRLTGSHENLPMMVDCERGLGRPDKAIELGLTVDRSALSPAVNVELAIALSGARLDRGETERALLELEIPQLDPKRAFSYSPALFDAYAVVLEDLGRVDEAAIWGKRANRAAAALAEATSSDELVVVDAEEEESA